MATNIEIKARVADFQLLRERAEALSDMAAEVIIQEDIFFNVPSGRLKLRILAPDRGQLIFYRREDSAGPKRSDYFISTTTEPDTLRDVLAKALAARGIVRKKRSLYWVGNTRIHLDEVEGLGAYLELEVVLADGQTTDEGEAIAFDLMSALGVGEKDLVQGAYIDLLEKKVG